MAGLTNNVPRRSPLPCENGRDCYSWLQKATTAYAITVASSKGTKLFSNVDEGWDAVQTIMTIPFELAAVMR